MCPQEGEEQDQNTLKRTEMEGLWPHRAAAGSASDQALTTGCRHLGAWNLAETGIECSKTSLRGVTYGVQVWSENPCRALGL